MSAEPCSTFVVVDLAGFTALTEAHGDDVAADLALAFSAKVRELLAECGGQEVKQLGDAILMRIADPATAVDVAARIVAEAAQEHGALGVRVGMHTGPAVERDGDWFGHTVNVASRVAGEARSGEVVLTEATRGAAGPALEGRLLTRKGPTALRNVSEPVELWSVIVAGGQDAQGLPLDPVCRMAVDPDLTGELRAAFRGAEFVFCSAACRRAFERDPLRYATTAPRGGPPKSLTHEQ